MGEGGDGLSPAGQLSALESAAYLLARSGSLVEARQVFATVTDLLPATGYQDVGGQNVYTKARIEYLSGSWDEALATIRSGTLRLEFEGLRNNLAWLRLLEAEIHTNRAPQVEAADIVDDALLPAECILYAVMQEVRRANIALRLGDHSRAEAILTQQPRDRSRHGLGRALPPAPRNARRALRDDGPSRLKRSSTPWSYERKSTAARVLSRRSRPTWPLRR